MEETLMRNLKSHTDFFVGLYKVLLTEDIVRFYGQPLQFDRDFRCIENRVKNEGFSFLTKTLPSLAKAIDKALVEGFLTIPTAFKKAKGKAYPAFMQVLLGMVFDREGFVKTDPSVTAVRDLRQVCYLCYKYEETYEEKTISIFLENFKDVDSSLGWDPDFTGYSFETQEVILSILNVARKLLHDVLQDFDGNDIIEPRHGPGAVATGEKNWEKMNFARKYDCIHQVYPYYKFFFANAMDLAASVKKYKSLEQLPSGIAKVVLVPKDSRGPRLISMEPLEFQWIQQGLSRTLVKFIENHELTRGHVNFTDQEINRKLALRGSVSGDIVTLDMKEASDRVSLWLVRELFRDTPILAHLEGTRTEATELPTQEILLMRKFAPMGSALCFPVESLVHWSLAVATLNVVDRKSMKYARKSVYVYGDDIVIKGKNHMSLFDTFPYFKLKFNKDKCCTTGIFRESCGMDAVLGESVSIMKIKKPLPSSPYDAEGMVSYLETCNRLGSDGYAASSLHVGKYLLKVYGRIPHVQENSGVPGFVSEAMLLSNPSSFKHRWNEELQRSEWYVRVPVARKHYRNLCRREYLRALLTRSEEFRPGVYAEPRSIKLKWGWFPGLATQDHQLRKLSA
jgi:hypothetical protein